MKGLQKTALCIMLCLLLSLTGCTVTVKDTSNTGTQKQETDAADAGAGNASGDAADADTVHTSQDTADADIVHAGAEGTSAELPNAAQASGEPYQTVNNNEPDFSEEEITTESFEQYAKLDELGRCGAAFACVGTDLMPMEKRGNISRVKPTGWHSTRYDFIDGNNLYNRCHLIAYQLSGENANENNLITGTRYMNVSGMLPFEEQVGDYVRETGNHVMYRVTPVFLGDNLVADGVQMEAMSVEDGGAGVSYNVYVFNIQPGIEIDYATGESKESGQQDTAEDGGGSSYVLNINTKKFHLPGCGSAQQIQEGNREDFTGDRQQLIERGYEPCGSCKP